MSASAERFFHGAFRRNFLPRFLVTVAALFAVNSGAASAQNPAQNPALNPAQDSALQLDPQHTTINFTLGDVLHNVHGSFKLKHGELHLDRTGNKLSGEIVVDAKSGESGNGMRDRKMHRELLESDRYPEIYFRPDRFEGSVPQRGKASVRVHGIFGMHGLDRELTVPADVEMFPDHWTATLHFPLPYVNWGIKNPSTLFLRVSESVDIDLTAAGSLRRP